MPRSPQPGSCASVRATGLVLVLCATVAGAAGAVHLTPVEPSIPERDPAAPSPPPIPSPPAAELDAHLHAHAERVVIEEWNAAVGENMLAVADRVAMWDELANCETGGNWADGGQYGGGLGIYVGTWKMYGGHEFAAKPQYATKAQQIEVAERIARDGYGGWGCAHRLGWVD